MQRVRRKRADNTPRHHGHRRASARDAAQLQGSHPVHRNLNWIAHELFRCHRSAEVVRTLNDVWMQAMTDPSDDTLEQFCFHLARHDVQAASSVIEPVAGIATMSDEFGTTALISACEHAELPVIELLCRRGADVNARAETGETPLVNLVRAARFGDARDQVGCARLLLAHGADPDRLVYDGTNALHQAIIHSQVDLVRLLLASGADPAVRLDDGPSQEDAFELARSGRPRGDAQARQAIVDALSSVQP